VNSTITQTFKSFNAIKSSAKTVLCITTNETSLRRIVISTCHSSPFAGHSGITRTLFLFSLYAWNVAPIDGTDLPRSLVAIGRDFPCPIDLSSATARDSATEGQAALDHFESASPQTTTAACSPQCRTSPKTRRHPQRRHEATYVRHWRPGYPTQTSQVQHESNTSKIISAKLLSNTRGPYRVIDRITPSSYRLQKLRFLQGMGRPGRLCKENGARMERLPSTLILHRKVDGAGTRFSQLHGEFADAPIYKWLGVLRHGAYQQAPSDSTWAFESLASMWTDADAIDERNNDSSSEDGKFTTSMLTSLTKTTLTRVQCPQLSRPLCHLQCPATRPLAPR
jgi:hypothetical protein